MTGLRRNTKTVRSGNTSDAELLQQSAEQYMT